jgi:Ni/Fe-hydrogenase subunit HybB-like protein
MRLMRLTPGRAVLWLMVLGGLVLSTIRYIYGLGAVTHLSDRFPWGLWVAFDVMSGVALAAGGFTVAALVYVFHLEQFHPLVRPAIVTGFLGYLLVIVGLLVDLGRPYRIWHALVMWNPHSVMYEVAWCVMLYTTVLTLEFGQVVLERLRQVALLRITRLALPPLVIAGVVLSTLHQSSLGSLFLIVPAKLHPLWYTPMLPLLFFVSAIAVGLAMVTVEAWASARIFNRTLETPLLRQLGRGTAYILAVYLALKGADLVARGAWRHLFTPGVESLMFSLEIVAGVIVPLLLLGRPAARAGGRGIGMASALVVLGVILNRLNVGVTGMLAGSQTRYVPSWMEVQITLAIVAAGVVAYLWIAEHLPVFVTPAGESGRVLQPAADDGPSSVGEFGQHRAHGIGEPVAEPYIGGTLHR